MFSWDWDWLSFDRRQVSMYEVGGYFSQHKFVVRRCKNKMKQRRKIR